MDSSKIEVGDVFTHIVTGGKEYVATKIDELGRIWSSDSHWAAASNCTLVRKADPYAGITLPEPPAGHRLAKWGEEYDKRNGKFWAVGRGAWIDWQMAIGQINYSLEMPLSGVYAIPLDQPSPLKSWQFREVPWVQPEPRTLADVPDEVDVIASGERRSMDCCRVMFHRGKQVYFRTADWTARQSEWGLDDCQFVRYLDLPPQKLLTLDDVPYGRCLQVGEDSPTSFPVLYWKAGNTWWISDVRTGEIKPAYPPCEKWTVTNYIAEFRGPA